MELKTYEMGKREDYECPKYDWDNHYYYMWTNEKEVKDYYEIDNQPLKDAVRQYDQEQNDGVYIKGARLYFTLKGQKYRIIGGCRDSWTWDDNIKAFMTKLNGLFGCDKFYINYGEID